MKKLIKINSKNTSIMKHQASLCLTSKCTIKFISYIDRYLYKQRCLIFLKITGHEPYLVWELEKAIYNFNSHLIKYDDINHMQHKIHIFSTSGIECEINCELSNGELYMTIKNSDNSKKAIYYIYDRDRSIIIQEKIFSNDYLIPVRHRMIEIWIYFNLYNIFM